MLFLCLLSHKIHKGLNIAFRVHFFHYTASELIYRSVESTNCVVSILLSSTWKQTYQWEKRSRTL